MFYYCQNTLLVEVRDSLLTHFVGRVSILGCGDWYLSNCRNARGIYFSWLNVSILVELFYWVKKKNENIVFIMNSMAAAFLALGR